MSEIVPILIHDGEQVNSDADEAKVFKKVFFQGGHIPDKCFLESFLNGAVSVVVVASNESTNNLEQFSMNDICCDINRRITMNELIAAIRRVDKSKGAGPYGLHDGF